MNKKQIVFTAPKKVALLDADFNSNLNENEVLVKLSYSTFTTNVSLKWESRQWL